MFLGIDIGTSAIKAVVLDDEDHIVGQSSAPLAVSRPRPSWSEQDPDAWCVATEAVVSALPAALRRHVEAIGLAGQMHGATVLGADDRPLRPAILWNDGRSAAACTEIEANEPRLRAISGNRAMPGFTAPKLHWIRHHEPDVFSKVCCVLLPKDYVRLHLTGEKASDLSDAAGTLWLDVEGRQWSVDLLAATGLGLDHMPRVMESCEISGTLRADVAQRWGMARVPVVAGAGDNAAGAAGIGVIANGDAMLSLGTSGVIFVSTEQFRPNPERAVHAFCHCLPGMWHQMSVHLSAASCIDWAVRLANLSGPTEVFALAEAAGFGQGPELFLPYLSGERSPHDDPHVRGALLRADNDTSTGRLCAAILEGVAFAHADGLAALREAGTKVERLTVIGGGSRTRSWGQVLAAVLDATLDYVDGGEIGPALGAAKLARMAATGTTADEACTRPPRVASIDPDPLLAERLAPKLQAFRRAYPAIRTL